MHGARYPQRGRREPPFTTSLPRASSTFCPESRYTSSLVSSSSFMSAVQWGHLRTRENIPARTAPKPNSATKSPHSTDPQEARDSQNEGSGRDVLRPFRPQHRSDDPPANSIPTWRSDFSSPWWKSRRLKGPDRDFKRGEPRARGPKQIPRQAKRGKKGQTTAGAGKPGRRPTRALPRHALHESRPTRELGRELVGENESEKDSGTWSFAKPGSEKYSAACRFVNRNRKKYFGSSFFPPGRSKSTLERRRSDVGELRGLGRSSTAAVDELKATGKPSPSAVGDLSGAGTSSP